MADKSIAEKLLIKPGRSIYLVNAPRGYAARLNPLPDGVKRVTRPATPGLQGVAMILIDDDWSALRLKVV